MMKFDVVIIGGGVVGCAAARELSRYSLSICLLEAASDICEGASKANTAIVHAGHDAKSGTSKARFNALGSSMFERVASELSVPFERNGSLVVAFSEDKLPELEALRERGVRNGIAGLHVIGQEKLRELEPNIGAEAAGALFAPSGGIVCPYELTVGFAENAAMNGAKFIRNAAVSSVKKGGDGRWLVESAAGSFSARAVVNCAGAYADEINNMASEHKLSISPRRGEYYIIDKKFAGAFKSAIFQLPTAMGKGVLIAPTVDGTILIGPNAEDIPDKEDKRTTAEGLDDVMRRAALTWNSIPKKGIITTFAGIRAHEAGDDFVIGEAGDAPLFFNAAGIESPGLSSAPAIAEYLADAIADRLDAEPKADFDPIRPAIPRFREMTNEERAEAIAQNPDYAKVVCRCETVTEAEIREAIRRPVGARTIDGIKRRTRAGMGRCQAGFCLSRTMELLAEETGTPEAAQTKCGGASRLVFGGVFDGEGEAE